MIEFNLFDFILSIAFLFQFLLHFDLEAGHDTLLELARVQLAYEARIAGIRAFDAKDHEHVNLSGLGYVVVRHMD